MKNVLKTNSIILVLVLIFNMLFPILSMAADESVTITFQEANLYEAVVAELGSKIESKKDSARTITITQSNLETITTLELSNKKIANISGLEKFTYLTKLYLNVNEISDISPIATLTKLEWLNFDHNKISDLSSLSNLTNLVYLNLKGNELSDITPLATLTNLRYLYLENNKISDVSQLSTLVNVRDLTLNNNQLENTTGLSNLKNMTTLFLHSNKLEDISSLSTATNLTTLYLSNNKITDISSLSNLTKLKKLYLDTNNVTDFTAISNLTELETLYLSDLQISDITFLTNLTNVKYLYLAKNNITDIRALANLKELDTLSLAENSKLADISSLANCTKITKLYLQNNNIEDISKLESITNLAELGIGNNKIRDLSVIDKLSSVKLVNNWYVYSYDNTKNAEAKLDSSYQTINKLVSITDIREEIVLPKIFTQVKDSNSKLYTADELELVGCTLSTDGKILTLNTDASEASVTIKGGPIANSKFIARINDATPPVLEVGYSITELTNGAVTVTIKANKELKELEGWTLSEDKLTLTKVYTQNKEEKITVEDFAGNNATANIAVNNIDISAPEIELNYTTTVQTNENVTVTIKSNEKLQQLEGWSLSTDGLILTKEYAQNASEEVTVKDLVGNERKIQVQVSNIDTIAPQAEVEYSTTEKTEGTVTVTVKANEKMQQLEGWTLEQDGIALTKVYAQNEQEEIIVKDLAGNETKVTITVNNIDDLTAPQADIQYSTTEATNKNVTVTIVANEKIQKVESWTLSEDELTLTKEYTQNGEEEITIKDLAGNEKIIPIKIENIDKTLPEAQVEYSTTELTNNTVTVKISVNEKVQQLEGWTLDEEGKKLTKTYTKNGEEVVVVKDLAGNEIKVSVSVKNIDTTIPEIQIQYSTTKKTNEKVTVTLTSNEAVQQLEGWTLSSDKQTLTKVYAKNATEEVTVKDLAGNERKVSVKVSNIENQKEDDDKEDNTVAGGEIPQAGQSIMVIISVLAIMVLGIVSYVKLRKFKDVK